MKINLEVDCTPEEARRAMGLPDFTPVHDKYVAMLLDAIGTNPSPEIIDTMLRSWTPMGEAGMNFWQKLFETSRKTGG